MISNRLRKATKAMFAVVSQGVDAYGVNPLVPACLYKNILFFQRVRYMEQLNSASREQRQHLPTLLPKGLPTCAGSDMVESMLSIKPLIAKKYNLTTQTSDSTQRHRGKINIYAQVHTAHTTGCETVSMGFVPVRQYVSTNYTIHSERFQTPLHHLAKTYMEKTRQFLSVSDLERHQTNARMSADHDFAFFIIHVSVRHPICKNVSTTTVTPTSIWKHPSPSPIVDATSDARQLPMRKVRRDLPTTASAHSV